MILLDTNILARLANDTDPDYKQTHAAVAGCRRNGHRLFVANQCLYEFWTVATRPVNKNGLDMSPDRADRFLKHFMRVFPRLPEPETLFDAWRSLVNGHGITGLRAHDVRLAAFVQTTGLNRIMTYNLQHFRAFGILLVNPNDPATW